MRALAPSRLSVSYMAFILHRLSGLALALFLPLHFLLLGLAIDGDARLDQALAWTDRPLVKFAEGVIVVLFSLHLLLGVRVLVLEWGPWSGNLRAGWVGGGIALSLLAGAVFAMGVL